VIIGGIGFGFFIDELGKFITSDNDYFFEPAAALIYLIFVGLFLLVRRLRRQAGLSSPERIANALEIAAEAARGHLDEDEKRRALELLEGADPGDPLREPVRRLLSELAAIQPPEPSRATRLTRAVRARYYALVERDWFRPALAWVFGLWALLVSIFLTRVFAFVESQSGRSSAWPSTSCC